MHTDLRNLNGNIAKSYLRIALGYLVFCLALLQLARAAFVIATPQLKPSATVAHAWLLGLRFDLSITAIVLGLPLIMLALPLPSKIRTLWQRIWISVASCAVVVLAFMCIADFYYVLEAQRHIGQEILTVSNDVDFLFTYTWSQSKAGLALLLLFVVPLATWHWRKVIHTPIRTSLVSCMFALLLSALAIRGSVTAKPLNPIDAFTAHQGQYELAQLQLNGPFLMFDALQQATPSIDAIAAAQARTVLNTSSTEAFFARQTQRATAHNVIVVLLESWSAQYVDTFSAQPLHVTPVMDSLAATGLVFPNFYAAGQRSYEGIQAVLTGLPALPGVPSLSEGLYIRTSSLGTLANQHGIRTILMQASKRRSLRLDAVAAKLGFTEYYGKEDIPKVLLDYPDPAAFRFGWDYESTQFLVDQLHNESQPFFACLFTGSTHSPFAAVPTHTRASQYAHDPDQAFLDVLHYADWSLGQFIERARQEPWFDNTVFIFTADHTRGNDQQLRNRFHIPLVLYAPKIFPPQVDLRLGTQPDLFDTTLALLGLETHYASSGHSLLTPSNFDKALFRAGENLGLLTPTQSLIYSDAMHSSTDPDARFLSAYRTLLYSAVLHDRWLPAKE